VSRNRSEALFAYGPNPAKRYFRYLIDPIAAPCQRWSSIVKSPWSVYPVSRRRLATAKTTLAASATFLCGYTNGYIGYFPTM
jgi:hypothetical protein